MSKVHLPKSGQSRVCDVRGEIHIHLFMFGKILVDIHTKIGMIRTCCQNRK